MTEPVTCWKCGFVLDVRDPLRCTLPDCQDQECPLDQRGGWAEGARPTTSKTEVET